MCHYYNYCFCLLGVTQNMLETVVPKRVRPVVRIVRGLNRNEVIKLWVLPNL